MHLKGARLYLDFQTELSLMFWFPMGFTVLVVFLAFFFFLSPSLFIHLKNGGCCCCSFLFWVRRGRFSSSTGKNMLSFHKHMEILISTNLLFLSMEDSLETQPPTWNGSKWWKSIFSLCPLFQQGRWTILEYWHWPCPQKVVPLP